MSELRNILKASTIDAATADQIHTVGGRVFLDASSIVDLNDFARIVDSWRGVHALSYGGPIAGTDTTTTHNMQTDAVEAVLTPQNTEVERIVAVQVANGGGQPMEAALYVGGVNTGAQNININPSEEAGFCMCVPIVVGNSTPLQVKITSGSATDATVKVAHVKVGQ